MEWNISLRKGDLILRRYRNTRELSEDFPGDVGEFPDNFDAIPQLRHDPTKRGACVCSEFKLVSFVQFRVFMRRGVGRMYGIAGRQICIAILNSDSSLCALDDGNC